MDERKKNLNVKVVWGLFLLYAPMIIFQIVVLELLKFGVVSNFVALTLTLVMAVLALGAILLIGRTMLLPLKAAITGEAMEQPNIRIREKRKSF